MPRTRKWLLFGMALLVLASVSLAQTQPKAQHPRRTKKTAPKPMILPPLPNGPLPQLPMDLMPAAPPKVGFQGGLLTIVAQNSTLSDILRDVHKLTGATIDMPPNASERVVTRLGPGAPRDVIASLLNGSTFNYVMLGSPSDPAAVTSVVLTPKPTGAQSPAMANAYQPSQGYVPPNPRPYPVQQVPPQTAVVQPTPGAGDDNANGDEQDTSGDENADQDQGVADTNGTVQPDQQQPQTEPPPNAGPKTPEQILEMLRRQQQQPPTAVPPNPQQPPEN